MKKSNYTPKRATEMQAPKTELPKIGQKLKTSKRYIAFFTAFTVIVASVSIFAFAYNGGNNNESTEFDGIFPVPVDTTSPGGIEGEENETGGGGAGGGDTGTGGGGGQPGTGGGNGGGQPGTGGGGDGGGQPGTGGGDGGGQPDTGGGDGGGQPGTGGGDGGQPDTGGGGTTQPPTTQPPTPPPAPTPAPLPVAPAPLPPIVIPGAPQPPQPSPPTTALVPPIPTSPPQVNVNVSAGTAGGSSAAVSLPSQVNSAGIASLSVTENAINQAIAAVRNSLQTESNVAVVISPTNAGANGINASLNRAVFNRVSAAGVALQISTNNFSVEISPVTLRQISENITGPVRVSVNPVNNLFPAAREAVGNRPVFTFGVRTLSGAAIPGLQSSSMVFGINYQPTDAETVFVARIVGSQITEVPSTFANGVFTWVGTPGGTYGIATR